MAPPDILDPSQILDRTTVPALSERYALNPGEAAAYIGCSRQHIYNLMAAGKLPSSKVGRSRRIPRHALEALIDGAP